MNFQGGFDFYGGFTDSFILETLDLLIHLSNVLNGYCVLRC